MKERGVQMPYVNIQVTREGTAQGAVSTTPGQKAALIKGVTDLLFDVMRKPPNTTFVVIEEVELENWGVGGLPAEDYRRLQLQGKAGDV
jgi:4-oxalocrotonate tautomerase